MGCNEVILLDTHTLIWLDQGNQNLGKKTRKLIDTALKTDSLAVSSITWWEAAMLQSKNRIELPPIQSWYRELIDAGLEEIPVDGLTGIAAAELKPFHGDPADRIITATAILKNATLVTANENILSWRGELKRSDARK